jgi:hypothetical protein
MDVSKMPTDELWKLNCSGLLNARQSNRTSDVRLMNIRLSDTNRDSREAKLRSSQSGIVFFGT